MRPFIALAVAFSGIAQASSVQHSEKILIQGNAAGNQTVQTDATGAARAEYSYNDRGRGDHIIATWKLDAAGVPTEYEGHGNDYMKAPVEEQFEVKDGKARWKIAPNRASKPLVAKGSMCRPMRRRNSRVCL